MPTPGVDPALNALAAAGDLYRRAAQHADLGELNTAAAIYKRALAIQPTHEPTHEGLAQVYLTQGKLAKASTQYVELARVLPQTLNDFAKVLHTLKRLIPTLEACLADAATASIETLSEESIAQTQDASSIAANPYFRIVLESTTVRDIGLERWLTALRGAMLRATLAGEQLAGDDLLAFASALAQQCFINEYVFAVSPAEAEQVQRLKAMLTEASERGAPLDAMHLLVCAMYAGLNSLPNVSAIAARTWPGRVAAVLTQQVHEPKLEQDLRASMPRLTPISGGVTAEVREQYEESPYPRWVRLRTPPNVLANIDEQIRLQFPAAPFRPVGHGDLLEVLEAGCGTGRHALEFAQSYRGARVLAVDLSLASLASAKRKIPAALSGSIEFAQADILLIGSIGRSFDLINTGGVLHHMGDPLAGWRELIKLLKPNGLMQVGLYSAYARREVVAIRKRIAERGYRPTLDDIRRCRQELIDGPERFRFMGLNDFFSTSDCRDLLFHVHERQFTIPEIKAFLAENDMRFIGFHFRSSEEHNHYRNLFARAGWSFSDLDRWDAFERQHPDVFIAMYNFWIQRN